jgi:hypothetical protein
VIKVQLALLVIKVQLALLEIKELQVLKDHKVHKE